MVQEKLGFTLEKYLFKRNEPFSPSCAFKIGIQLVDQMRIIHDAGYTYNDLKLDNILVGDCKEMPNYKQTLHKIRMIDFGLAKRYIKKDGTHIDFSDNKKFCGTAKYASIAAHENHEQSRKDDLEAIAYILIYLFKGKLPWQGIKTKDKKKRYSLIYKQKTKYTADELCKGMPREFIVFLDYVKTLSFDEKPPYNSFKKMFTRLYDRLEFKDNSFEWEK